VERNTLLIGLVSWCVLAGFLPAEARRVAIVSIGQGEALVSHLTGSAEVMENGTWAPLRVNDALDEGDQVRTGKGSRIELVLPDRSRVRFAGDSEFRMARIEGGGSSTPRDVKIHVALGRAWSNIARIVGMKGGRFEQSCERAVAGVRGTVYRMDVEQDTSALVRVYDGEVEVAGGGKTPEQKASLGPPTKVTGPKPVPGPHKVTMEEWTVLIKAMQQVRIGADGVPEKPRDFTEAEDRDEWVEWNRARDLEIGPR
jgi:hypothetical protein